MRKKVGVITWAEVVSYAPELNNFSFISISQIIFFVFWGVYAVFFLLEVEHIRFTDVYSFFFSFAIIGAVLVIVEGIGYIVFMYQNKGVKKNPANITEQSGFMGGHYIRDIYICFIVHIIGYLIIVGCFSAWLNQFNKTFGNSQPNVGLEPEWRIFNVSFFFFFIEKRKMTFSLEHLQPFNDNFNH